jgi:hypothetical protein
MRVVPAVRRTALVVAGLGAAFWFGHASTTDQPGTARPAPSAPVTVNVPAINFATLNPAYTAPAQASQSDDTSDEYTVPGQLSPVNVNPSDDPYPSTAPSDVLPGYDDPSWPREPLQTPSPVAVAGPTAECVDGTYSYSQHRQGTCSHHGGVAIWYP